MQQFEINDDKSFYDGFGEQWGRAGETASGILRKGKTRMAIAAESDHYQAKADFSDIYNEYDPRPYYRTLGALGYEIPSHGTAVFERLLGALGDREGRTVLDVCCGYGANATLLNYEVDLPEIYEHYVSLAAAADDTVAAIDRDWFATRRRPDAVSAVGLDVAENAVRYATSIGLLDRGVVADLEKEAPDEAAQQVFATADLVTVTGGIGYVGERTFRAIVEAAGDDPPWVAALSLRWVDFSPVAETLDDLGLVVEQLDSYCVPQRRFAHEQEREAALAGLHARGLDPAQELLLDSHCAELYVARPPEAARDTPIGDILGSLTAG